jgi:hypothetical protein
MFRLSSFWFSLAPLGGLPSRITKLCILINGLFDDAPLPAARNGLNSHQRRDTNNIDLLGEFGEILF